MDDAAVLAHVEAWIDRCRDRFAGPAIAFGLTDRERTLGTLAIGDAAPGTPLRPDHLFLIASVSKSFTAALVMQEVGAGHLSLEEPITTFLPWFAPPSTFAPITAHHLLTHTAGLASGWDSTGDAIHELLLLVDQELASAPGERHVYSNAGYKALGLVLEAVTGRPWWDLARERLLGPLGMVATEPIVTDDIRPRLATGWVPPLDDRPWHPEHGLAQAPWYESSTADGTICSNAQDMAAYLRMYLRDGVPVLPAELVHRMMTPAVPDPEIEGEYAYGLWVLRGERALVGHSGSLPGYRSMILLDRAAGLGAVVLTNGDVTWELRRELLAFALASARAASADDDLPQLPEPTTRRSMLEPSAAGRYLDHLGAIELEEDGGGIALRVDANRAPLERTDADRYVSSLEGWDRFDLIVEREAGAAVHVVHGTRMLEREGRPSMPPPPGDPSWVPFIGRYRAYGIEPMLVTVLERAGTLRLVSPGMGMDDELVPLEDGRFRVGVDPWQPGRARFEMALGDRATRLLLDGASFYRAP